MSIKYINENDYGNSFKLNYINNNFVSEDVEGAIEEVSSQI